MVVVWANGFTVQIPGDVWCGEASDLEERGEAILVPLDLLCMFSHAGVPDLVRIQTFS